MSMLVGVSGGVDSMVLVHLLHASGRRVEVAHVNHGLRAGADADEQLVRAWCRDRDVPIHVLRLDHPPATGSIQAWARDERYAHFVRTARSRAQADVAVAHHADDQAETVALQQARSAGPDGLSGMAPSRPLAPGIVLHRPLLAWTRADILAYARRHDIVWREDPGNANPAYARTRVREHLRTAPPRAAAELLETARAAQAQVDAWQAALPRELVPLLERSARPAGVPVPGTAGLRIPLEPLRALPEDMRAWFLLRLMDGWGPRRASMVSAVTSLLAAQPGVTAEFGALRIVRDREHLTFLDQEEDAARVRMADSGLRIHPASAPPDDPRTPPHVAWLNADAIQGPLRLRSWRPGDRFHPFGAPGSRKVKRFLTDAGVPPSEKSGVSVLTDDVGIVWIPGLRMDERMRLSADATAAIRVEWERAPAFPKLDEVRSSPGLRTPPTPEPPSPACP
ncbi:MAG: tRNA lysidine(34) synthetase TilS [Rhodothermales bacterium]